jgi:hypothetical protein
MRTKDPRFLVPCGGKWRNNGEVNGAVGKTVYSGSGPACRYLMPVGDRFLWALAKKGFCQRAVPIAMASPTDLPATLQAASASRSDTGTTPIDVP